MLAYLVGKHGDGETRGEVPAVLWEGRPYDRRMQKEFNMDFRSLPDLLRAYGIENIFALSRRTFQVCSEWFTCDEYRFFDGDSDIVSAFRGEHMSVYSCASITENMMYWKTTDTNLSNVYKTYRYIPLLFRLF